MARLVSPKPLKAELAQNVESWFSQNARTLPWRFSSDPYAIWVSEIMLQQTRVDTVIPRFNSFMKRFPKVQSLAEADLDEVRSEWAGLGYYRRCHNLWKGARFVVNELAGLIPTTRPELQKIPGIGAYTSAAIAALAFDVPVSAVDGNVLRVIGRVLGKELSVSSNLLKREVQEFGDALVREGKPSILTQALMEIGAMVCQPSKAQCGICPLKKGCKASRLEDPTSVPFPAKRKAPEKWTGIVVVAIDKFDRVLLEKRPEKGLLAGLWIPPSRIGPGKDKAFQAAALEPHKHLTEILGDSNIEVERSGQAKWRFTHILLEPVVVKTRCSSICPGPNQELRTLDEWQSEAVPSATYALLAAVGMK